MCHDDTDTTRESALHTLHLLGFVNTSGETILSAIPVGVRKRCHATLVILAIVNMLIQLARYMYQRRYGTGYERVCSIHRTKYSISYVYWSNGTT